MNLLRMSILLNLYLPDKPVGTQENKLSNLPIQILKELLCLLHDLVTDKKPTSAFQEWYAHVFILDWKKQVILVCYGATGPVAQLVRAADS